MYFIFNGKVLSNWLPCAWYRNPLELCVCLLMFQAVVKYWFCSLKVSTESFIIAFRHCHVGGLHRVLQSVPIVDHNHLDDPFTISNHVYQG